MKLLVTNEERAAVASWLIATSWDAPEETLGNLLDAYESLRLKEFVAVFDGQKFNFTDKLISQSLSEVEITPEAAAVLLATFPGVKTAGLFGPAKVRLLRKLRALVPKEEPKKEETPAEA